MKWEPRGPQGVMRDFLLDHKRCNLWAGMGTGKTSVYLTVADILQMAGSRFFPTLVLAPKRVARDTWPAEQGKWDHLRSMGVHGVVGTPTERKAALRRDGLVYAVNYENIPWLVDLFGKKNWPFKSIVADESRKLSNFRIRHGGVRAAALSRIAKMTHRWVNMTGTPAPEGLADLWGPNWFVDFGHTLGHTHTAFASRWFRKTDFGLEAYAHAREQIMNLIAPFTLSIDPKDWYDGLEDPVYQPIYFELPPKARRVYNEMELDMFSEIDSYTSVEAMNSGSKYGKCSQIASGAVYTDEHHNWELIHDAKIAALGELVDEMCGDPLLVAYHFKHDRERILRAFPKARVYDTKQDEDDWNAGRIPIMLAHPASAGHGLNWQDGGCNIAIFSQIPSLELRMQIIERIGPLRQMQAGHPRPVNVYDLIALDTVNELDYARSKDKASVQDAMREYVRRRK